MWVERDRREQISRPWANFGVGPGVEESGRGKFIAGACEGSREKGELLGTASRRTPSELDTTAVVHTVQCLRPTVIRRTDGERARWRSFVNQISGKAHGPSPRRSTIASPCRAALSDTPECPSQSHTSC